MFKPRASKESTEEPVLNSLDDAKKYVKEEIHNYDMFKNTLIEVLREVKDIEANLNLIKKQLNALKDIMKKRKNIMNELFIIHQTRANEVDLKKANKYIEALEHLSEEVNQIITKINEEVQKIRVTSSHVIYAQSEYNKERMTHFDEEAKTISVEISHIYAEFSGQMGYLKQIKERLTRIAQETPQKNIDQKREFVGFRNS